MSLNLVLVLLWTIIPGATWKHTGTNFVGIKHGYHIPGGTLAFVDVTQDQCIRKCARNPDCLALDYNIVILECWFHDASTYCKEPALKLGCVHVKRIPCIRELNNFQQIFTGANMAGGQEMCNSCSLRKCVRMCNTHSIEQCKAIDYNNGDKKCYRHNATTACSMPRGYKSVTHFTKSRCGVTTLPFGNIMQTLKLFAKKPELNTNPFQIIPKLPDQKSYPQLSAQEIEILSNRQAYRQKWPLLPEPPNYKQMYSGSKATTNLFHNKHIKNRYGYPNTQAKIRNMEPPVPAPVPISAPAAPHRSKVEKNNSSRDHYHYKVGPPGPSGPPGVSKVVHIILLHLLKPFGSRMGGIKWQYKDPRVLSPDVSNDYNLKVHLRTTLPPIGLQQLEPTLPMGWVGYQDTPVPGGVKLLDNITPSDCIQFCKADVYCGLLDYDRRDQSCWMHNILRQCYTLRKRNGILHMKKRPCAQPYQRPDIVGD